MQAIEIGLFEPNSHRVIPCTHSPVHHPSINIIATTILAACRVCGIEGYSEDSNSGLLKYLVMSVEGSSQSVQLALVWNTLPPPSPSAISSSEDLLQMLIRTLCNLLTSTSLMTKLHSVWVNYHFTATHINAITGRELNGWRHLWGKAGAQEECLNFSDWQYQYKDHPQSHIYLSTPPVLYYPHTVFRQANFVGFTAIIREIRRWVPRQGRCIELYAGVGTIGLSILDRVEWLQCSDENPHNKACFEKSISALPAEIQRKAFYLGLPAAEVAVQTKLAGCDFVIVDPPRKGLDIEVLEALCSSDDSIAVERLIYVSCGFKAFQRDCAMLLASSPSSSTPTSSLARYHHLPRWKLVHAEGHVLFPGSDHIETLAVFDRVDCPRLTM